MTLKLDTLLPAGLLCAQLLLSSTAWAQSTQAHAGPVPGMSKVALTDATMRDLWLGHAFWVRAVVVETLRGNPAASAAAEGEAVANARQLAASMEPFYGAPASAKVFTLLAGHYAAVKEYLRATAANSAAGQDAARQAMVENAEQIAVFLSGANPYLPVDALRGMLLAHGGHHVQQIQQLAERQYGKEAQTWGAMKSHMYGIADAMTLALARQFPAKFE